nr:DUF982 domain-containing protein [Mesorhizobium sp.]
MPVSVALGRSGNIIKVEPVAQAADILINRWPVATGKAMWPPEKRAWPSWKGSKKLARQGRRS